MATTMAPPQVRKARFGPVDFTKVDAWLAEHRHEYIGQWIVLDDDRLVGHGPDPRPIVAKARAEGVIAPFVELIRDRSKPFMGGWL